MRAEIANGRDTFAYGTTTSPGSLAVLADFLALCKERGIVVIGFLPPYAPGLYDEVGSVDDAYAHERDNLGGDVRTIFDQYDFLFFDFSHAAAHGIAETEFIDPTHGSDKAYARILLDMATHDSVLTRYVSISRLRDMIAASPSDFINVPADE
jgi:hypothetical protein